MKYYITSRISENIHETPEGYLVCLGVPIARTGEMLYAAQETPLEPSEEGTVTITRTEDEVFRPETIASFEGKAITITHPTDFVGPDNWNRLAKGILQNVRRGSGENKDDLIADLLITDSMAIGLVKNGLREVSCGYEADYIQTGKGRGLQTKLIGNHLALVDQGRAGSSYAINDHKGKGAQKMKLGDRIKAIFAKAQDEAMAAAKDADEPMPKKEDKKEESKDEAAMAYDEIKKMVADLGEKISKMGQPKDASTEPSENAPAEIEAKDEEVAPGLEDRLKAVEAAVAKLMERESKEDEVPVGDDDMEGEMVGDEDEDKGEESEDAGMQSESGVKLTGDTASRIEILAPGLKAQGKDAKTKAIKAAYATKDGKKVIDQLTGGKPPLLDTPEKVNTIFIAASELLKATRTADFAGTKQTRDFDPAGSEAKAAITAEKMNEINAKFYNKH